MSVLVLILTHFASAGLAALVTYHMTVRYLTVKKVGGRKVLGVENSLSMAPKTDSTRLLAVVLIASLIVVLIGGLSYLTVKEFKEGQDENTNRIIDGECEDAYSWLIVLNAPREPGDSPRTKQEQEFLDSWVAREERTIREFDCADRDLDVPPALTQ